MAIKATLGTPFVGYISLTNSAGNGLIPVYTARNGAAAYVLPQTERLVITNFTISSNDSAVDLVQITDNAPGTPTVLYSGYAAASFPPTIVSIASDILRGWPGVNLKATSSTITSTKTVEIIVYGVITKSN
jgi:hypothetical protein